MKRTTRYLILQIAGPLVFVTFTLTGVIWLTQSLRYIDRIVNNGISISSFLYLTSLLLPAALAVILPIATFCAVLWAYNRLNIESELVVLSAVGFSRPALARPALIVTAVVMAISYILLLYFVPAGSRTFRSMQWEFRNNFAGVLLQEGAFNNPMPGLTVYVRERSANGELMGILIHDNRDSQRPITMMAERGVLVRSATGPRFQMENGNRQQVEPGRKQVGLLYFTSYNLDLDSFMTREGEGWHEPGERMLDELFWPDMNNPNDAQHYWSLIAEGHRRLATPLMVPALVLIALAMILGAEFDRRGQSKRLIWAGVAGVAVQIIQLGVVQAAQKTPALIPLMYLNPVLFAAIALWLLRDGAPVALIENMRRKAALVR